MSRDQSVPHAGAPQLVPRSLRWAQVAVLIVAAVHIAALVLVLTHQDELHATVATDHPGWLPSEIETQARQEIVQSAFPHVVLPLVLSWRARALTSGRNRARIVLVVLLAAQMAAHGTLPLVMQRLPDHAPAVIGIQAFSFAFEVAALVLLWHPATRAFFRTGHRRNETRRGDHRRGIPTRWTRPQQLTAATYGLWTTVFTVLVALAADTTGPTRVAGILGASVSSLLCLTIAAGAIRGHTWAFWIGLGWFAITGFGAIWVPLRDHAHIGEHGWTLITHAFINDAPGLFVATWMLIGLLRFKRSWAQRTPGRTAAVR